MLSYGSFDAEEANIALIECDGDVRKAADLLIERQLQPAIQRVWNAILNPENVQEQDPENVPNAVREKLLNADLKKDVICHYSI